jgi:hypothetical protein
MPQPKGPRYIDRTVPRYETTAGVPQQTPFSVAQDMLAAMQRIEALLLRQIERDHTNVMAKASKADAAK